MVPGSTVIRYGYGLGTYMDGEADIGATPHMFVGKSTSYNPLPSSLSLPTSYHTWLSLNTNYDEDSFLLHYDKGGTNREAYCSGGGTAKKLPKLIYLPLEAAKVVIVIEKQWSES